VAPTRDPARWDARIARARELAPDHASAREPLSFLVELSAYQRALFLGAAIHGDDPGAFTDSVDVAAVAAAVPDFVVWLATHGPAPLARAAAVIRSDSAHWHALVRERLRIDGLPVEPATAFVIDAVLQPFAEAAAAGRPRTSTAVDDRGMLSSRCPVCSALPVVGVLHEESQGAKRMLICSRCLSDWNYLRVVCPGCGEEGFDALPVYTADAFPHVRIETCDACRRYLKTIDLTRNGLAIPVIDDVASLTLDLWASERGYRRLQSNLLRTGEPAPAPGGAPP
jgi:FdhE protein